MLDSDFSGTEIEIFIKVLFLTTKYHFHFLSDWETFAKSSGNLEALPDNKKQTSWHAACESPFTWISCF